MTEKPGYSRERLLEEAEPFFRELRAKPDLASARRWLYMQTAREQFHSPAGRPGDPGFVTLRDCARALRGMISERADERAGFSVMRALWDLARGERRADLQRAFFADMIHLFRGLLGREQISFLIPDAHPDPELTGREAAVARSDELDRLNRAAQPFITRCEDGLSPASRRRRTARRRAVLAALGGTSGDWNDWTWHAAHVLRDPDTVRAAIPLTPGEEAAVRAACAGGVPFGITPYYASLMDADPGRARDRAVRAQVLPPPDAVRETIAARASRSCAFDFMREGDTSPVDLITRRYPNIVILKPFNTCPQICVYCQRNWEIERPMETDALAPWDRIEQACEWIGARPAIREVLVTGGDPFALEDEPLLRILDRVAAIPHVEMIRVGTRVPVTLPMRVTGELARRLGRLRAPGRREVCVMTHVEHPYEVTPELVAAVGRLRRRGIAVYNQLVYTFFISRRFEAARLRRLLRLVGIDPYYTFAPKGKEETGPYRVPLARLLQEQKEEARLLPGLSRTDEAVYNVPGLGKNYLRAAQHRDMLAVRADGARVYEFHPWEKNIALRESYVGADVPILEYLERLEAIGERAGDYESIWHYF